MSAQPLEAGSMQSALSLAALTPCPGSTSRGAQGSTGSRRHGTASLRGRVWAAFLSVYEQLISLSACLCTAAAAACKCACLNAGGLSEGVEAIVRSLCGRVSALFCPEGHRGGNTRNSTAAPHGTAQSLQRRVPDISIPVCKTTPPQGPAQTEQAASVLAGSSVRDQGKEPLSIGSLLLPDQAYVCEFLGLRSLVAFAGAYRQARAHVQSYLQQRCRGLRGTNDRLLVQFGIACPEGEPSLAQVQDMVNRTETILKAMEEAIKRTGMVGPHVPACTAEELILRLPPKVLQNVLQTAQRCNLCAAFAKLAKLPPALRLEGAVGHSHAWVHGEEARGVARLRCHHGDLSCVSIEIEQLTSLQELHLAGNKLVSIPAEPFRKLTNLQRLYLQHNQLKELPRTIGKLRNLRELDLGHNQLRELPSTIGNLQELQTLNLAENQLEAVPSTTKSLRNLRDLDLSSNQLRAVPAEIGELERLEDLYLYGNHFATLEPGLWRLTKLRTLSLGDNLLTEISPRIGRLKSLQVLLLFHNQLKSLPDEIGDLPELERLNLQRNQLITLPTSLERLRKLCSLNVGGNTNLMIPTEALHRLVKASEPYA